MVANAMPTRSDIVALETSYWEAIKQKDGKRTARLSGETSLVTGPRGVLSIPKDEMGAMTEEASWELEHYELGDVEVLTPSPDVAIIAYTVRQTIRMNGETRNMRAADSSTWVRGPAGWECLAHSETFLDDPKAA